VKLWSDDIEAMRPEARACVERQLETVRAAYNSRPPLDAGADRFERARAIRASMPDFPAHPGGRDDVVGGVPCRRFEPSERAPRAIYVHFHGGGMVVGSPEMNDFANAAFADRHGVVVLSVRYRTAPEAPYPAPNDDALAVTRAVIATGAPRFGVNEVLLGGESAGAYLAAATLLRLRDEDGTTSRVRGVKLAYGCYDWGRTPRVDGVRPVLDAGGGAFFRECFLPGATPEQQCDPQISPLFASLGGLAPALISVGTEDHLLDDSLGLAARWAAAGNDMDLFVAPDLPHSFDMYRCGITEAYAALEAAWIEARLEGGA